VDVVDASGESICETVTVEEFGMVACVTKAQEIDSEISLLKDGTTYAWYSRGVSDAEIDCPDPDERYTVEYWEAYYEDNYGFDLATYEAYALSDMSFDFRTYYLDLNDTLTEDDLETYLTYDGEDGSFDWSTYLLDNCDYLTEEDIMNFYDSDSESFDWDGYAAAQWAMLTPVTTNNGDLVNVQWAIPESFGAVTFRIEIQDSEGNWIDDALQMRVDAVIEGDNVDVEMVYLRDEPFNLVQGDMI
jgi:hypothetical protein